jgi:hypothetical protein
MARWTPGVASTPVVTAPAVKSSARSNAMVTLKSLLLPGQLIAFGIIMEQMFPNFRPDVSINQSRLSHVFLRHQDNVLRAKRLFNGVLKNETFVHPSSMSGGYTYTTRDTISNPSGFDFESSYEMLIGPEFNPFVYLQGTLLMAKDLRYGFNVKIIGTFHNLDAWQNWYSTDRGMFDCDIDVYFQRSGYDFKKIQTIVVKSWSDEVANTLQQSLKVLIPGQRWLSCERCATT